MSFMKSRKPLAAVVLLATLGGSVAMACGDDDKDGGTPTATTTGTAGTISVSSSAITGQDGKVLLVFAAPDTGGPVARACIRITSNSFTAPATVMAAMAANQDPCSEPSDPVVLTAGSYKVTAGIYKPPASQAERESSQTVQVTATGAAKVTLDGAALSAK